jgi:hypothetical protein
MAAFRKGGTMFELTRLTVNCGNKTEIQCEVWNDTLNVYVYDDGNISFGACKPLRELTKDSIYKLATDLYAVAFNVRIPPGLIHEDNKPHQRNVIDLASAVQRLAMGIV